MNPAKAYAHLFSPRGGDDPDTLRDSGAVQMPEVNPELSRQRIYKAEGVILRIMAANAKARGELVDQPLRRPAS